MYGMFASGSLREFLHPAYHTQVYCISDFPRQKERKKESKILLLYVYVMFACPSLRFKERK